MVPITNKMPDPVPSPRLQGLGRTTGVMGGMCGATGSAQWRLQEACSGGDVGGVLPRVAAQKAYSGGGMEGAQRSSGVTQEVRSGGDVGQWEA
jgi:hypothetical protein